MDRRLNHNYKGTRPLDYFFYREPLRSQRNEKKVNWFISIYFNRGVSICTYDCFQRSIQKRAAKECRTAEKGDQN